MGGLNAGWTAVPGEVQGAEVKSVSRELAAFRRAQSWTSLSSAFLFTQRIIVILFAFSDDQATKVS